MTLHLFPSRPRPDDDLRQPSVTMPLVGGARPDPEELETGLTCSASPNKSANARALGVDLLDETQEVLRATVRP